VTEQEKTDLNRRVAVALGYKPVETGSGWVLVGTFGARVTPPGVFYTTADMAWEDCPDFCTDPAAADLVRLEIERRRRDQSASSRWCEATKVQRYRHFIKERDGHEVGEGVSMESPYHALCLAFLESDEAEKTEEGGEASEESLAAMRAEWNSHVRGDTKRDGTTLLEYASADGCYISRVEGGSVTKEGGEE